MDKNDATNETLAAHRPTLRRLMHTLIEVALSIPFAGGVFMASLRLMCLNNHACNDFGGVAFFVASFMVATVVWGMFLSLCKRFRDRPSARKVLDVSVVAITAALWILSFLLM